MRLNNSEKDKLVKLVQSAIPKVGDRLSLKEELETLLDKIQSEEVFDFDTIKLNSSVTIEELSYVNEVIKRIEELIEDYVKRTDVNDIVKLEEIKKEVSVNLMYLSSYKDKFNYEVEYLDDVFKKEIFSDIASEISLREGISINQAEKKTNSVEKYKELRKELTDLKRNMGYFKTKYDFFSKMVQVIVQSISVASKENYITKVNN